MVKLLSTISLILALVLFPPAALALVSNNAVPGDVTYPIKRTLEDIIFAVASLNPVTKAWFAAARSDRRFQEVSVLITQGKQAGETLNELVEQTQTAADQIDQIADQNQKTQLINQISASIEKYDQGLQEISQNQIGRNIASNQSQPAQVEPLTPAAVGTESAPPPAKPSDLPKSPAASSTPAATLVPISPVSDIKKAREDLEKIKQKLQEEGKQPTQRREKSEDRKEDKKSDSQKEQKHSKER